MTDEEVRKGIEGAIRYNRAPLVIKQCERPGCTNEIRRRTYGPGRRYCSNDCRYAKSSQKASQPHDRD